MPTPSELFEKLNKNAFELFSLSRDIENVSGFRHDAITIPADLCPEQWAGQRDVPFEFHGKPVVWGEKFGLVYHLKESD